MLIIGEMCRSVYQYIILSVSAPKAIEHLKPSPSLYRSNKYLCKESEQIWLKIFPMKTSSLLSKINSSFLVLQERTERCFSSNKFESINFRVIFKTNNIILIAFAILSCGESRISDQENSIEYRLNAPDSLSRQQAVAYNDSAVNLIMEVVPFEDSKNNVLYNRALCFLDLAIDADSLYQLAYSNKVDVLRKLGRHKDAIKLLERLTEIFDEYAEAYASRGFLYEKIGKIDSASMMYSMALELYNKRIIEEPENINNRINLAFILLFTNSKKDALFEIQEVIEGTNSQEAADFKLVIESFDRSEFISEY